MSNDVPFAVARDVPRRAMLGGLASAAVLPLLAALPGCATSERFSFVEAVRRLLMLSSMSAFDRLMAPGGFYDNQLARLELPETFGVRGGAMQNILAGPLFRDRLQRQLNRVAEDGARRAAPIVADTIRTISYGNALDLIRGEPTAATRYLRGVMAGRLIDVMFPAIGDAMRLANDPLMGQVLSAMAGVDVPAIARDLAVQADAAIWGEIGREEAAIRADPRRTRDPLLLAAFGLR